MPAPGMLSAANEMLSENRDIIIKVRGSSMYPFLRNKKDSVLIVPAKNKKIKPGDIVFLCTPSQSFILHRVIYRNADGYYVSGDAQKVSSGPFRKEQIVGVVTKIWKGKKQINPRTGICYISALLWIVLLPYRHLIIKSRRLLLHLSIK